MTTKSKSQQEPTHPMDDFPVRPLDFDVNNVAPEDCAWSKSSPFSHKISQRLGAAAKLLAGIEKIINLAARTARNPAPTRCAVQSFLARQATQTGQPPCRVMGNNIVPMNIRYFTGLAQTGKGHGDNLFTHKEP